MNGNKVATACQNACAWCFARSRMEQDRSQGIEKMDWQDFTAAVEFYERSGFRHMTLLGLAAILIAVVLAGGLVAPVHASGGSATIAPPLAKKHVAAHAQAVVEAIRNKDGDRLAEFVHPDKGVCFSPYNGPCSSPAFKPAKVRTLWQDSRRYLWGHFDGSGNDIRMPFTKYATRFVYDRDYAKAPQRFYNEPVRRGGDFYNPLENHPNDIILVEYHIPGEGVAWRSLKLLFKKRGDAWYVVSIIHDEWTI